MPLELLVFRILRNLLVCRKIILGCERRCPVGVPARVDQLKELGGKARRRADAPVQTFVHEDAERPVVRRLVVARFAQHLGRHVLWRAAARECSARHVLGKPKVADFDVAHGVEQDVLGLQVAVDVVLGVQRLQREDDVPRVKASALLGEPAVFEQLQEQLEVSKAIAEDVLRREKQLRDQKCRPPRWMTTALEGHVRSRNRTAVKYSRKS